MCRFNLVPGASVGLENAKNVIYDLYYLQIKLLSYYYIRIFVYILYCNTFLV